MKAETVLLILAVDCICSTLVPGQNTHRSNAEILRTALRSKGGLVLTPDEVALLRENSIPLGYGGKGGSGRIRGGNGGAGIGGSPGGPGIGGDGGEGHMAGNGGAGIGGDDKTPGGKGGFGIGGNGAAGRIAVGIGGTGTGGKGDIMGKGIDGKSGNYCGNYASSHRCNSAEDDIVSEIDFKTGSSGIKKPKSKGNTKNGHKHEII